VKDSFFEDLECVFDKFPKYCMNILLGNSNAKAGWEDIFKLTIGNERLHEISNDNGIKVGHVERMPEEVWKIWMLRWKLIVLGKQLEKI
jgi:hypothetical protein